MENAVQLTPNFSLAELTVTSSRYRNDPNPAEITNLRLLAEKILQPLRDSLDRPVLVNSAFRSDSVNRSVGGSSTSQHRLGQAADIRVEGMTSLQVAKAIKDLGLPFDQVIEEFGRWVHVSYGPRHRRQILSAVTRKGKTVYLPGLSTD